MLYLLFICVIKNSIKIINTKIDKGTISLNFDNVPYILLFEYPEGCKFNRKFISLEINQEKKNYRSAIKVDKNTTLSYKKSLCKGYEYDMLYEKGITLKFWIIKNNNIEYLELLDWMPIPDLSIVFVASLSFGILLCIILKSLQI